MVNIAQLSSETTASSMKSYGQLKDVYVNKLYARGLTSADVDATMNSIDAVGLAVTTGKLIDADAKIHSCKRESPHNYNNSSEMGGIRTPVGINAPSYGGINPDNISTVSNVNDPNYGKNPIYAFYCSSHKGAGGSSSNGSAAGSGELAKAEASHAIIMKQREDREIQERLLAEAHDIQDSTDSLYWEDPVFPEPVFTAPIAIQNARYTLDEDYPNTYGFIDKIGNWIKVNMVKMHIEFVHNKGSNFKIEKDSNSMLHLKGSHKQVIDKDFSQHIAKNRDVVVDLDDFEHILGEMIQLIDKKVYQKIGKTYTQEIGDDAKITIEGNSEHTINKDSKMLVTENMEWKIGETGKIQVGQSLKIGSGEDLTITAFNIKNGSTAKIKNVSQLDTINESFTNIINKADIDITTEAKRDIINKADGSIINECSEAKVNTMPDIVYNMDCGTITMCEIYNHIKG